MKLTVSRETFLAKLGIAVRGASTRSAIQTLAGVLLRGRGRPRELEATDMELGVRVGLEPTESSPGQAVIPGRLLLDVVRSLPTDQLARVPQRPAGRRGGRRAGEVPPAHAAARGLPEAAAEAPARAG